MTKHHPFSPIKGGLVQNADNFSFLLREGLQLTNVGNLCSLYLTLDPGEQDIKRNKQDAGSM